MKTSIQSFAIITLTVIGFALAPQAGAQSCKQGCDDGNNTFLGYGALQLNGGVENTAIGWSALYFNTTGALNTASGSSALFRNTTGNLNTATGSGALYNNTTGDNNTAVGFDALSANTIASNNTAIGYLALVDNITGYRNTATGVNALYSNSSGHGNTAIGYQALYQNNGSDNVAVGFNAGNFLTNGSGNVCIGSGVLGVDGESNTTRIKNIHSSVASGRAVYVNSDNKIGTLVSSRRFKEKIKPMERTSEAILALKPVTFHYKKEIESNGSLMFGLIAEDVEKVDPDLVTRNEKGEADTVRYEAVNAMLLNEFLKEHRRVEEQHTTITKLKSAIAQQRKEFEAAIARQRGTTEALVARLNEQEAKMQQVTDQIEMNTSAQRVVAENR